MSLCRNLLLLAATGWLVASGFAHAQEHLIWQDKPAEHFTESTPLGNGRLGAMLFGGVADEHIILNESGMWSGSPQQADRLDAHEYLPQIRELLFAKKYVAAERLMRAHFVCAGAGSNRGRSAEFPYGSYQLLGELDIEFSKMTSDEVPSDYRRELDLEHAVCRISYSTQDYKILREAFTTAADQVFVYRIRAEQGEPISCALTLSRPEHAEVVAVGSDQLHLFGQLPDGKQGDDGVRFSSRLQVVTADGDVAADDNEIKVLGASDIMILVSAATDLSSIRKHVTKDPAEETADVLARAATKSYRQLLAAHTEEYARFYRRVSLSLETATSESVRNVPTARRLSKQAEGEIDPSLATLYFNFGRYLLISSSRPGGLPANLQGIWADGVQTPWNGDWHLNVNVQMNYWPAEVCNLSELHDPLFALIRSLVPPGRKTAEAYYAARGWVAHVLANPWGFTSPGEDPSWGSTSTGSAWLCQHIWDHYLFNGDKDFLEQSYPILKEASQFYLDTLVEYPELGKLVTAPSNSPENSFYVPNGDEGRISVGSTMDMQIIRYLFTATAAAAEVLDTDKDFSRELTATLDRLHSTQIGADGRILEWSEEFKEVDPFHRHVSHLWGLYPGNEISPELTPKLARAARKSLDARGDEGTGWGLANKICMWARLGDGNRAHRLLLNHLRPVGNRQSNARWTGGTYPNLFDAHPPFQIDGNFGGAAAIAEMLLQSSFDPVADEPVARIHLLPALPDAWQTGQFAGFRARGGFTVAATWEEGRLISVSLLSHNGTPCLLQLADKKQGLNLEAGEQGELNGQLEVLQQ